MTRILICGSRGWNKVGPIETIIAGHLAQGSVTVVHGDAPKGADAIANALGKKLGAKVVPVPANWDRFGKGAGLIRNQKMLDEQHPQIVYAFRAHGKSNGTDDMVERSLNAGLPTFVVTDAADTGQEALWDEPSTETD